MLSTKAVHGWLRRRARGFLKLLRRIDRVVQGNPAVHLILDS